jgi:hypothetical protein
MLHPGARPKLKKNQQPPRTQQRENKIKNNLFQEQEKFKIFSIV